MTTPAEPRTNPSSFVARWAMWRERVQRGWTWAHRLAQHLWLDASDTARMVDQDALARITARVASSEQGHTGQIRVCLEAALPLSYVWRANPQEPLDAVVRQRALMMFSKLRVWDTAHNNGLLIYVLLAEKAIEIVADRGLIDRVPAVQWEQLMRQLSSEFGNAHFEQGLADAIEVCSALLMLHFPRPLSEDPEVLAAARNELPDEPIRQ